VDKGFKLREKVGTPEEWYNFQSAFANVMIREIDNGEYLRFRLKEASQGSAPYAFDLYNDVLEEGNFTEEEMLGNNEAVKRKINETLDKVNKRDLETTYNITEPANKVVTMDGITKVYDREADGNKGFKLGK
jgi:hypothetical protein